LSVDINRLSVDISRLSEDMRPFAVDIRRSIVGVSFRSWSRILSAGGDALHVMPACQTPSRECHAAGAKSALAASPGESIRVWRLGWAERGIVCPQVGQSNRKPRNPCQRRGALVALLRIHSGQKIADQPEPGLGRP
jgi:hypothetical protein